ncbi:ferric-rhodotorulic acid/ferric-coprogen receptor FhuE [Scandinavium manionii]|uniref:ferric-rhodotorulic acid/ferric-coprogen receptor FhuE n=1 Tax=Scandinavium manionii TaxID=2926520 RepID=UPI00216605BF|nr:ferric-rhodotorulic acid/ferric-coprogen receptor FhuE [Scandinavium manionii]MCS2164675.1 ferric-rhodotorulic acid/ferric-coprogen receptor FhuE [Scandinavium manionii]
MSFTFDTRNKQHRLPASPSLLAACIAFALIPHTVHAADANNEETVVVEGAAESTTGNAPDQDYSVKTTTTGTRLLLVPRDIPQSVSVISQQRMKDQNLQTIGQVLTNTTGVTAQVQDSDRTVFYSRGFFVSNYAYDDLPTSISEVWNFGDTAIYDRIEVVRGATGLMSGTGNPAAYVNMVRKHADSREFQGNASVSYGSWDKQRYVLDLQAPLIESGNVRGRVIAGYQDNDSWMDNYHYRKKFLYGVVDADITDSTTLSLGYEYQESNTADPTWGGLPTWYADGSKTHYDRSDTVAPDWAYSDKDSTKVFANFTQRFDNGWEAHVNGMHAETNFDTKLMYMSGYPDRDTGGGMVGYGGWNRGERKQDAVDAFLRGDFELFGRQHEMMVGGSLSHQRNHYDNSMPDALYGMVDIGNFKNWSSNIADPQWTAWKLYSKDDINQSSAYTSARFSLADPLHLILGARYTNYNIKYNPAGAPDTRLESTKDDVTPYAGLVYDINEDWSAYVSYTNIFQPQDKRDANGRYLDPTTGKSYEAGVKADWFNTRLTTSLAVFRIEQDHVANNTYTYLPSGESIYESLDGVVSQGVEFELNGALTDNWQLTFGATRYVAEDKDGNAISSDQPRTTLKLFTRYQLPMLPELSVGGGMNWQNKTWANVSGGPDGRDYVDQGSYGLVNLFSRYQMTKNFALQANVNNLFDKEYYAYVGSYLVYGAPLNFSVSASYDF